MKKLLFDTNALYRLSEDRSFFPKLCKKIKNQYEIVVAPLVLVESMTRALSNRHFRNQHIRYAFSKLKEFSPRILLDQDELIEMVAVNGTNYFSTNANWSLVVNHMNRCYYKNVEKQGEDLYYKTKNGERRIYAYNWQWVRQNWEAQYQTDWKTMLSSIGPFKNITQQKAFANNLLNTPIWNNIILNIFQQRSGHQVTPSNQNQILDFMKYIGAEYQNIWYSALANGYHPYSNKNKNDYNDMHLLLYASLPDVYLLSFDKNMLKKVASVNTLGKIINGFSFV